MIRVKATREGLPGGRTSTGYHIEDQVPFVALPSTAALRLWIRLHNPANDKVVRALCLDVGPWEETDHAYVFQAATMTRMGLAVPPHTVRPRAESGIDSRGRTTNGAGIDLGERVWLELGMEGNTDVDWELD